MSAATETNNFNYNLASNQHEAGRRAGWGGLVWRPLNFIGFSCELQTLKGKNYFNKT